MLKISSIFIFLYFFSVFIKADHNCKEVEEKIDRLQNKADEIEQVNLTGTIKLYDEMEQELANKDDFLCLLELAKAWNNKAYVYNLYNLYGKGLAYYQKSCDMKRDLLNKQLLTEEQKQSLRISLAKTLHNLSSSNYQLGNYKNAEDFIQKSLSLKIQICEDNKNENNLISLAETYLLMSSIYKSTQYYEKSLEKEQLALDIFINLSKENKKLQYHVSKALNNLSYTYFLMYKNRLGNDYWKKSLSAIEQSIEIKKNREGIFPLSIASSIENRGNLKFEDGDYTEAKKDYELAYELKKNITSAISDLSILNSFTNLGNCESRLKNYEQAEKYLLQAMEQAEKIYPVEHYEVAKVYKNLGAFYYRRGNFDKSLMYAQKSFYLYQIVYFRQLMLLASYQKIFQAKNFFDDPLSIILNLVAKSPENQKLIDYALWFHLWRKGIATKIFNLEKKIATEVDQKEIKHLYEKYIFSIGQLSKLKRKNELDDPHILEIKENLERELTEKCIYFSDAKEYLLDKPDSSMIIKKLQKTYEKIHPETIILEYVIYTKISDVDEKWIGVFIVEKDSIHYVDLCKESEIKENFESVMMKLTGDIEKCRLKSLQTFQKGIYQSELKNCEETLKKNLHNIYLFIVPTSVREKLEQKNYHLIISPDGFIHNVSFTMFTDQKGEYLVNRHYISYTNSILSFSEPKELLSHPKGKFLEVCNPEFGYQDDNYWTRISNLTPFNTKDLYKKLFSEYHFEFLSGHSASEKSFRETITNKTWIDIVTHGFSSEYIEKRLNIEVYNKNPLLSAGIVLAEANKTNLNSENDGYFFAQDFAFSDLNCECICIWGCNTGIGQNIDGEGSFGIKWGITEYAKAQNAILSLWPVAQMETLDIRKKFYTQLLTEKSITKALINSQRAFIKELEQNDQVAHPYLWAGFITVGQELINDKTEKIITKNKNTNIHFSFYNSKKEKIVWDTLPFSIEVELVQPSNYKISIEIKKNINLYVKEWDKKKCTEVLQTDKQGVYAISRDITNILSLQYFFIFSDTPIPIESQNKEISKIRTFGRQQKYNENIDTIILDIIFAK